MSKCRLRCHGFPITQRELWFVYVHISRLTSCVVNSTTRIAQQSFYCSYYIVFSVKLVEGLVEYLMALYEDFSFFFHLQIVNKESPFVTAFCNMCTTVTRPSQVVFLFLVTLCIQPFDISFLFYLPLLVVFHVHSDTFLSLILMHLCISLLIPWLEAIGYK